MKYIVLSSIDVEHFVQLVNAVARWRRNNSRSQVFSGNDSGEQR